MTTKTKTAGSRLKQVAFENGLKTLARELEIGTEFPDACWRASSRNNTPYEALQEEYDERCANGTWPPDDL